MEFLESRHNALQIEAIREGLSRKTFVLIQGIPGTGKTQTILGILSAILHSTPARVQFSTNIVVILQFTCRGGLLHQRHGSKLDIHEKYVYSLLIYVAIKIHPLEIGISLVKGGTQRMRLPPKQALRKVRCTQSYPRMRRGCFRNRTYDTNSRDKFMRIDGDDGLFPGNELKPEVVNSNRKYGVRALVCAPSNSALDEILLRVSKTGAGDLLQSFHVLEQVKIKALGFLNDSRRINVGITRARSSVLVVGSSSTLKRDGRTTHWANLVKSAEDRKCLFKVPRPYYSFFTDENLEALRVKDETMIEAVEIPMEETENIAMYGNLVSGPKQGQGGDDDSGDDGGFEEDLYKRI